MILTHRASFKNTVAGVCLHMAVLASGHSALAQPVTPPQSPAPWSATAPSVAVGKIERLDPVPSQNIDARPIDVWLPPGYSTAKRYAVLYMHDGQMLFDATQTWNKAAWNVHLAVARLMATGEIRDTIVVGIPNNGKYRYSEFYPDKFLALAPQRAQDDYRRRAQWGFGLADAYLTYLVRELKPLIDQRYSTLPDRDNTFVMGSSMGGLITLYALCEYPEVFGGAAALSTHWVGRPTAWGIESHVQNAALPLAALHYLQARVPRPRNHKFYMDRGTLGLEALYAPHQAMVDVLMAELGYRSTDFDSRIFAGTGHTEADWSARLEFPLRFLLAPQKNQASP
jgi:predicted alpha/beta superfamily hydrolase